MDWYNEKYWTIADPYPEPLRTAGQYLGTNHDKYVPYRQLNGDFYIEDGIYYVYDPDNYIHQKAITLEKFKELDIDIVIASYLGNVPTFRRLVDQYKPKAKLIHQMGNDWINAVDMGLVQNIMASTKEITLPENINGVFYHQEFDTEVFNYTEPAKGKSIVCLMNGLTGYPDSNLFFDMEKEMPNWKFKCYGAENRDGSIAGYKNVADAIKDSSFVWHVKAGGDGYGHVIHNAFACGRPPIVKYEYYKGLLAGELMIDEKTCIFIDGLASSDIVKKVEYYSEVDRYALMSKNAYEAFKSKVDFNKEEQNLRKFLEVLA
jgi:hypothetical protein